MAGSKAQSGASRDPTPVGRDPHPGGQRPSPSRAPTRTSRRAGIDQGDLPHTKVTTSSLRMQGDHKEQHSSHSLNQWKERFDLWHRHAGMLTRGEPYKLIGILNKEPRSLMTWFGPSPERGPRTQPTKNSTWVFSSINVTTMYSIKFPVTVRIYLQCFYRQDSGPILHILQRVFQFICVTSNVFNQKVDRSMVRTMAQCFIQCSIERKTIPSDRAMALMCSIKDNLPLLWYLENVKFWNESKESKDSKESKESVKCFCEIFRTLTLPCIPWD